MTQGKSYIEEEKKNSNLRVEEQEKKERDLKNRNKTLEVLETGLNYTDFYNRFKLDFILE